MKLVENLRALPYCAWFLACVVSCLLVCGFAGLLVCCFFLSHHVPAGRCDMPCPKRSLDFSSTHFKQQARLLERRHGCHCMVAAPVGICWLGSF